MSRAKPNVLITGTPGVGKSTTAASLAEASGLKHLNAGDMIISEELFTGYDEEFDTHTINDETLDKLCDMVEDSMTEGGIIFDYASCDYFPERWFDLVVVLRADNTVLFDRLSARGYQENKVQENVECEIMRVVADEAAASYPNTEVIELESNSVEQMQENIQKMEAWIQSYIQAHGQ